MDVKYLRTCKPNLILNTQRQELGGKLFKIGDTVMVLTGQVPALDSTKPNGRQQRKVLGSDGQRLSCIWKGEQSSTLNSPQKLAVPIKKMWLAPALRL